jgi:hypothetical protein
MKRPALVRIPLEAALPPRPGTLTVTMSPGQWDGLLAATYETGGTLLELDRQERPIAAYRNPLALTPAHRQ